MMVSWKLAMHVHESIGVKYKQDFNSASLLNCDTTQGIKVDHMA